MQVLVMNPKFVKTPNPKPNKQSIQFPKYPFFRANSFPKVTNLFCRIPLPTFFYALEAFHLGNLRRFSVRRRVGRISSMKIGPAIFKERNERTKYFQEKKILCREFRVFSP
jgi:hypothetical protein